ncbi:ABC transporter ATP-binding protein [Phenylobacterium sp.]|uniref:ABC transporter ATP-binding protein n=1 Tax=Phenylobacterium sp. TaxID=1871053 RepID=UPI00272FD59D|nr:ABC transporter ATP-binding protein [Phenylobacterium sp.]MDP1619092.1 ABC transporter ATP-binding protein [Phenylobacterium sp.]MDP1986197.1 ABC transporter ATP-binding protein [Phenylobacterium sp.]
MTTPSERLIEVQGLRHEIGGRCVMDVASFSAGRGEHTLLIGPSGSGKTTLINVITGLITPTAGEVRIDGQSMSSLPPAKRDQLRRRTIGVVFQTLRLISALTVRQNLSLAQTLALGQAEPKVIDELIGQVGLGHRADAMPRELSQGEGQRAAIARALCARPAIVVADEPTSALDDANALAMADLLLSTAEATGATLLIATHDNRLRDRFPRTLALTPPQVAA